MIQTWSAKDYARNAAFVHGMAGGVLEWLEAKRGESILDLGCGDGQLTLRLAATGASVVGVDLSPEMLAAARARGVDAREGSAESLPFPAAAFDAVFSNAVLHWIRDQDVMMAEVRRVLKPGGRFVAEMAGHGNLAAVRVAFMTVLARHGCHDPEEGVNCCPTPEAYQRRLERHEFLVERMALIPRPTPLPESGMEGWLRTFRRGVLESVQEPLRDTVVQQTAALLAPVLRDDEGKWTADYIRLRFIARV
ncbi:MAG: class I SAM-dependent methyltransferase [Terracidiphilus sp.]|jgi:SAM-dependent methyltransferase